MCWRIFTAVPAPEASTDAASATGARPLREIHGAHLDFGEARLGEPDFHLIYGPNEAGKSTLFSGFLDLVFGIERSSPYGFLHPYQTIGSAASSRPVTACITPTASSATPTA